MKERTEKNNVFLPDKKKMEALGRLSCKVAHDYNNILGAIEGYATLALNAARADDPVRQDLQEIRAAVARAAALGKQLMVFGGRQLLHKAPCEVNGLIKNALKMADSAAGVNFKLEALLEPGLPGITADAAQLERALAGLLVNAREAMPGGGTVSVASAALRLESGDINSPKPEEAGALFVKISVRDSGGGISPENLERLFEPLFSANKKGAGAGFGLAAVYGVVKQHNGWVEVKSEPGRGSEFSIFLPAAK